MSFQIRKSSSPFELNKISYLTKCPSFSFPYNDDQGWSCTLQEGTGLDTPAVDDGQDEAEMAGRMVEDPSTLEMYDWC